MRRHGAFALTTVLVFLCLALAAPQSMGPLALGGSALAQGGADSVPGASTELAIVALHCAEAPAAEALASYFATGTPPEACAPAVGVAIGVTEDDAAAPGSPFRTDVLGSVIVPVGLGARVEVAENPGSLPDEYVPLVGEANGVPYANPVRLDAAVAGAAVLFVNVPSAIAAVTEGVGTNDAVAPDVAGAAEQSGCDLTSSTIDEGDVVAPAPRAQHLTIANLGSNLTTTVPASSDVAIGGVQQTGSIAGARQFSFASAPIGGNPGLWRWHGRDLAAAWSRRFDGAGAGDWRVHGGGLWLWPGADVRTFVFSVNSAPIGDGVWFWDWKDLQADNWLWSRRLAAVRSDDGPRAIVVNFTRIGDGVWQWPGHDRDDDWRDHAGDPWAWNDGRNGNDDWSMNGGVWVWHGAFASSGSGSVAITGNGVRVWPGVWLWPSDRHWTGEWPWRARVRFNDWFQRGHGLWFWPGRIGIANLAAARSGSGSLAVVANVVQIGHGVWRLSPGQAGRGLGDWRWPRSSGSGIWVLSAAVARSSSGTLAISSHAVRIDTGVWLLPSDSDHGHTWLRQDGRDRADATSIESPSDNASAAVASPPGKLEPTGGAELPALASGEEAAVAALPADAMVPPGGDANLPTVDAAQPADNGGAVTAEPEANAVLAAAPMSTDVETAAVAPASVAEAVAPAPVASAPDASYVAPDAGYADLVPVEPALIPDAVAPAMMPSADAVYVEPAPVYVEPAFEAASEGNVGAVDPVFVEPVVDPGYAEPAVSPGFGDPGIDNPANFAPAPTFDPGIPAPDASAPSFVADPGGNTGGFAPAPVTAAPSGGGPGFDGAGATAPDIGFGDPGSSGPEAFVPDDMSPAAGVDLTDGDGEDG